MTAEESSADAAAAAYRRWLRAYPRHWRRANEAVLLGTLLDIAEAEGRVRPTAAEKGDLLAQGAAVRLRAVLPAYATRRLAASMAVVVGVAVSVTSLLAAELPLRADVSAWREPGRMGPFLTGGAVLYLAWTAVLALLLGGRHRAARGLLVALVPGALLVWPIARLAEVTAPSPQSCVGLAALALVACTVELRPGRDGARRVAMASAIGTVVLLALLRTRVFGGFGGGPDQFVAFGIEGWLSIGAATALVGGVLMLPWRPTWSPALLWLVVPWQAAGLMLSTVYTLIAYDHTYSAPVSALLLYLWGIPAAYVGVIALLMWAGLRLRERYRRGERRATG